MKIFLVRFIGEHGEVLMEKKLTALPLKEDFVIKKSIEFFNDPEPCMIHRSAVIKRIYMQIHDFLLGAVKGDQQQLEWDNLPCFINEAIEIQGKIRWISVI